MSTLQKPKSPSSKSARSKTVFVCRECGTFSPKWLGKCPGCERWNTLAEETARGSKSAMRSGNGPAAIPVRDITADDARRFSTGLGELDRALGGGPVRGGVTLVGGDPGIGKSTLFMQALAGVSRSGGHALYVTGEESAAQVALRATRLGTSGIQDVRVLATTSLVDVLRELDREPPLVTVIDSIQTLRSDSVESSPGSVGQLREVTSELVSLAKQQGIAMFLIGHVTKDGAIAGPKVLEHLVDTVLSFEGDASHTYRVVRATKNRFGPAQEIGVFEMVNEGLREVPEPSRLFLAERPMDAPGSVVVPTAEGTRTVLVELQALVSSAAYGAARRVVSGLDASRLSILLAVLDRKVGIHVLDQDVFAQVAGGTRVEERAADLALAIAVVSGLRSRPVVPGTAMFGEVGLAGEVRSVPRPGPRIAEAVSLGFGRIILPRGSAETLTGQERAQANLVPVATLAEALEHALS